MATVKLYFRAAKDITLRDDYALSVPDTYDETRELWDDGREFTLPAGYSVGKNVYGERNIYDPQDRECEIVPHSSGRPQLVSTSGMPVLKLAD